MGKHNKYQWRLRCTVQCTSLVSVVLQCKLLSGWGPMKWRPVPPYGPYGSWTTSFFFAVFYLLFQSEFIYSKVVVTASSETVKLFNLQHGRVQSQSPLNQAECLRSWWRWPEHRELFQTSPPHHRNTRQRYMLRAFHVHLTHTWMNEISVAWWNNS